MKFVLTADSLFFYCYGYKIWDGKNSLALDILKIWILIWQYIGMGDINTSIFNWSFFFSGNFVLFMYYYRYIIHIINIFKYRYLLIIIDNTVLLKVKYRLFFIKYRYIHDKIKNRIILSWMYRCHPYIYISY